MFKNIAIYGAQLMAGTIYAALKSLYNTQVSCFIVSDSSENPCSIDGIKVLTLYEYIAKDSHEQILIATPEEHHQVITEELEKRDISNYICLTSQMRNEILEEYYREYHRVGTVRGLREFQGMYQADSAYYRDGLRSAMANHANEFLKLYMVRCSRDRVLVHPFVMSDFMEQIQAGAILDDGSLGILRDDMGENISAKNHNYCELTALYWIWKNNLHEYTGLCHYRRIFDLQAQDVFGIKRMMPDVILPYPTIHFPDISTQYERYITTEEWKIMREAVLVCSPQMREAWDLIWSNRYFYNYNMLIARHEILDSFCTWLFSVLDKVEQLCQEAGIHTSRRYAGYMGEMLTTLYFQYHKQLKVVYTGVDILV
jgi:hypothetical protein